jgi:hypothetical protein
MVEEDSAVDVALASDVGAGVVVEEDFAVDVALMGDVGAGVVVEGAGPVEPEVLPHAPTANEMVSMPTVSRRNRCMVGMAVSRRHEWVSSGTSRSDQSILSASVSA